jgi:FMN-dependent oxidoreductase (nitrilotriacetate monooxygenase family)
MTAAQPRLRLNAFTQNTISHIHPGQWVRPESRQVEFNTLDPWLELARVLERGKFDAIFWADNIGLRDTNQGIRDASIEEGLHFPINDPSLLIPAMATVTEHLGFAYTSSVLQLHPFIFAKQVSTLDHLTGGRVAWNIVTSALENAARNLGFERLPSHADRYRRAEEYVQVIYKLLEGSWEDDALVQDLERGIYADPSKIHEIDHVGEFYSVVGPQLTQPSPQRTPVLFQAGASEEGRAFSSRNAEAVFIPTRSPDTVRGVVKDVRDRAAQAGRDRDDILFFTGLSFVVGSTEAEAKAKEAVVEQYASARGYAAHALGGLGIDLTSIPLDTPIGDLPEASSRGLATVLHETDPDKTLTLRDLLVFRNDKRVTGTPEQIADRIQEWVNAGINGLNVMYHTTPGSFVDFVDGVVPELQRRGLVQTEYREGTLREKYSDGAKGPLLHSTHPGSRIRRERLVSATSAQAAQLPPSTS